MNPDGRRIGVARLAAVLPGIRGLRRLNEKPGGGDVTTLLGYHGDAASGTVVAQDVLIVVPEDVGWWLRAEAYGTRQVYRAARTDVQLGAAQYRRRRYCDKEEFSFVFLFPSLFLRSPRSSRVALSLPKPIPSRSSVSTRINRDPKIRESSLRMKAFWGKVLSERGERGSLKSPRDP